MLEQWVTGVVEADGRIAIDTTVNLHPGDKISLLVRHESSSAPRGVSLEEAEGRLAAIPELTSDEAAEYDRISRMVVRRLAIAYPANKLVGYVVKSNKSDWKSHE